MMRTHVMGCGFAVVMVAAMLGACADSHGIKPASSGPRTVADVHADATFAGTDARTVPWPELKWWKAYADPGLDALMEEALTANPSLAAADARLRKALAAADLSRTMLVPKFTGGGSITYERLSKNFEVPPPYGGIWAWVNNAQVTANYELDLWGKNSAALASAVGQAKAAEIDSFAAKLALTTAVGQAYVQLAEAYDLRDVAQATLDARLKLLDLAKSRVVEGLDSQVDLKQQEALIPAAREQLAAYNESIHLAQNQLAALTGAGPDRGLNIPRPQIRLPQTIEVPLLPSHLPADLMGHRPDVVASRLRVEAAVKDIKAAKAAFYPNIDLTGFAGFQSIGLSRFLESGSAVAGIGPALNLPIFNNNTLRADLRARTADYDAAVATYDQTLINALKEIADDLTSLRTVTEQVAEEAQAEATAQAAYDLAVMRYKEGLGTYLQVLSAEQQLLAQRSLAADLHARHVILSVALIAALGGGFDQTVPLHEHP